MAILLTRPSPEFKGVRMATTADIANLATGAPNAVDGITPNVGDRILVKNQATARITQNGIYTVTTVGSGANGVWTRSDDALQSDQFRPGKGVEVAIGTAHGDSMWKMNAASPFTLGVSGVYFTTEYPDSHDVGEYRWLWAPTVTNTILYETMNRDLTTLAYTLVTAKIHCWGGITIDAGRTLTGISFWGVAAGTITARWYALVKQSDLSVLAVTANAGAAAMAANTDQSRLAFTAPYVSVEDTAVYVALGITFTLAPTVATRAASVHPVLAQQAPPVFGSSSTAATSTPPTVGSTIGAITGAPQQMAWAGIY